jgi:hypothetical protein
LITFAHRPDDGAASKKNAKTAWNLPFTSTSEVSRHAAFTRNLRSTSFVRNAPPI